LISFLGLLPRTLTTFLFALAALLRFYGTTDTEFLHLTTLDSKIDGLFSKYNIKLPQGKRPEQP